MAHIAARCNARSGDLRECNVGCGHHLPLSTNPHLHTGLCASPPPPPPSPGIFIFRR